MARVLKNQGSLKLGGGGAGENRKDGALIHGNSIQRNVFSHIPK